MKRALAAVTAATAVVGLIVPGTAQAAPSKVTYLVWAAGNTPEAGTISYSDHSGMPQAVNAVKLPWSTTVAWPYKDTVKQVTAIWGSGHIYCRILVDGQTILSNDGEKTVNCQDRIVPLPPD
ncbi:MmpS family transport accessory protein [Mycobacterium sp. NPDC050853]|uniref:MmpS family transport accessory protein n=1 Tax=Mycobacterium sp. NPDC050853 TaxID=3155160 RepID=UPI0034048F0D